MVDFKKILLRYYTNIVFLSRTVLLAIVVLLALDLVGILNLDRIIDYEVLFIIGVVSISIPIALYFEKEGKDEQRMKFEKYFLFFFILGIVLTILASLEYNILKEFDVYIAILTVACGFFTAYFNSERIQNQFEDQTSSNFLKTASYLLPVIIVASIFYINFHSFTTDEKLTLDVGNPDDTDINSEFYIAGDGLGPRQEVNGEYFRVIDGSAYAVYKPKNILRDATIEVTWEGEDLIYPEYPNIDEIEWDYEWDADNILDYFEIETQLFNYEDFLDGIPTDSPDFSKPFAIFFEWEAQENIVLADGDITLEQDARTITLKSEQSIITHTIDDFTIGQEFNATVGFDGEYIYLFVGQEYINAAKAENIQIVTKQNGKSFEFEEDKFEKKLKTKDGCIYFDKTRLEFPDSKDMFEEGPWSVYVEWVPEKQENNQQIIGHYNWEMFQNANNVSFRIGDMALGGKIRHSLSYQVDPFFSNQKNSLLGIYKESIIKNSPGFITMFVNNRLVGKKYFGTDSLRPDYSRNLSLGQTFHGGARFFEGQICSVKFSYTQPTQNYKNSLEINISEDDEITFALPSGKLHKLEINVIQ